MKVIETEVHKLIEYGFIWEKRHPNWVANFVPMLKKKEKIKVCIYFRDLNAACPKDEFLLPITDIMVDNTCDFKRMIIMDSFSSYNQVKMYPNDEKHMSFYTPLGVATYQRAISIIFCDHLWRWWNAMLTTSTVKSRNKGNHLHDLRTVFNIMRAH